MRNGWLPRHRDIVSKRRDLSTRWLLVQWTNTIKIKSSSPLVHSLILIFVCSNVNWIEYLWLWAGPVLGGRGPMLFSIKPALCCCVLEQSRVNKSREQLVLIGSRLSLALRSFFTCNCIFFLYYLEQNFMYMIKWVM